MISTPAPAHGFTKYINTSKYNRCSLPDQLSAAYPTRWLQLWRLSTWPASLSSRQDEWPMWLEGRPVEFVGILKARTSKAVVSRFPNLFIQVVTLLWMEVCILQSMHVHAILSKFQIHNQWVKPCSKGHQASCQASVRRRRWACHGVSTWSWFFIGITGQCVTCKP